MPINWKRSIFAALLLASLSLLLFGCSDYPAQTGAQGAAYKSISGIVSDPESGLPVQGASVTAYSVDASGAESSSALSVYPATATSDYRGRYTLRIPASYSGSVIVEADVSSGSVLKQLARILTASGPRKLRAAVAGKMVAGGAIPPVMVSLATDTAAEFVKQNYAASGFSSDNIRRATSALETLFGANFNQTPPPTSATDTNTSKAQQDLLVSIKAVNYMVNSNSGTVASMVSAMASSTGMGPLADSLKNGIAQATATLAAAGSLPPEYQPNQAINTALSNAQSAPVAMVDLSDTTAPTAPGNLSASAVAARKVTLSWSASSDDTAVAGYAICRAEGSSEVFVTIDTVPSGSISYADLYAQPQTHYSYRVVAFDKAHNLSAPSQVAGVNTPSEVDAVAPSMPAGVVCKGVGQGVVALQWQQSTKIAPNGIAVPAASYNVYRDYQLIATVTETSYSDRTVLPGSSYNYLVKAADADGNLSAASTALAVRTPAPVTATLPQAPSALALAAPAAYNKVALAWGGSATAGVTYNVYRDAQLIATGIAGVTYSDGAVVPNTSYVYAVTAVSASGAESAATNQVSALTAVNPGAVDATVPTVPASLVAVSVSSNSVSLAWSPSTVGGNAVAGYAVMRGDSSGKNFVKIASVRVPGYTDTTVSPSSVYSYQIRAFSSTGTVSELSAIWVAPTPAAVDLSDTTPPTAPTNLALASAASSASVQLTWSASTKSTGDQLVAGYLVYRDGAEVANVTSGTSFTDTSVSGGTSYLYTVKAYDNPGNISAASNQVAVTTPAAAPNTYGIYGRVVLDGSGLPGVMVTLGGSSSVSTVTDANGNYSFSGVSDGNYTLTVSAAGYYLFYPATKSVTVSDASLSGQLFTATLSAGVTAGVNYPDGTIIGGISYGGGTVLGGVTYPTGTVIGGILYPNGVIIGGISYPAGTIVGGIAFPVGAVTTGFSYPSGTVAGGFIYPTGTLSGSIGYPTGVVVGGAMYPTGSVSGGTIYPTGGLSGSVSYPTGSITGTLSWQ